MRRTLSKVLASALILVACAPTMQRPRSCARDASAETAYFAAVTAHEVTTDAWAIMAFLVDSAEAMLRRCQERIAVGIEEKCVEQSEHLQRYLLKLTAAEQARDGTGAVLEESARRLLKTSDAVRLGRAPHDACEVKDTRAQHPPPSFVLACDVSGGYLLSRGGEALVQVVRPPRGMDRPLFLCVVDPEGVARECSPLSRGSWSVQVQAGDRVRLAVDAHGTDAGLHARLCPSLPPLPFVEWTTDRQSYFHAGSRPPAQVQIVIQM